MRKELGKIKRAEFGMGGYQNVQFGVSFELGAKSWGVSDFWGHWGTKRSGSEQWTEADRNAHLGEVAMRVCQLLKDAKVDYLSELVDVPVEVVFDGSNRLESWRVLKEVI